MEVGGGKQQQGKKKRRRQEEEEDIGGDGDEEGEDGFYAQAAAAAAGKKAARKQKCAPWLCPACLLTRHGCLPVCISMPPCSKICGACHAGCEERQVSG